MVPKEIIIVGAGMVGMSIAYQLKEKFPDINITILEKEISLGMHSSGRNSGVLHAGIYYKPGTLKAKVCVDGAKRLKNFCELNNISIYNCGKVIVPQSANLDSQLDVLFKRGKSNGAEVELITKKQLFERAPDSVSSSDRAIWSPNTSVVNPKEVISCLKNNLEEKNVKFIFGCKIYKINDSERKIFFKNYNSDSKIYSEFLKYDYFFNCAGLQTDAVAHLMGVGKEFKILPFKGIYWDLIDNSPLKINTNIYPVPDLNVPFLGVHATPSPSGKVSFGPTAIPALGKENYKLFEAIEPLMSIDFFKELAYQFALNKNGFRKYAFEQAFLGIKPLFLDSAKKIIPNLRSDYLIPSKKVGIRAQLFNKRTRRLVDDFLIEKTDNSVHVLNCISPAFTASFSLADLIIAKTNTFDT